MSKVEGLPKCTPDVKGKFKTRSGRCLKVGDKVQEIEIIDRHLHTAGKDIIYDLNRNTFVRAYPGKTIKQIRDLYLRLGYTVENNIAYKKRYRMAQGTPGIHGKYYRAIYKFIDGKQPPKTYGELYKIICDERIMLYTDKERNEHIFEQAVQDEDGELIEVEKEYFPNLFVNLRFTFENSGEFEFRGVRANSLNNFLIDVKSKTSREATSESDGSTALGEGWDLDFRFFQLYFFKNDENVGGGKDKAVKSKAVKSKYYICKNIETTENNCLLGCIKLFTGDRTKIKSTRGKLVKEGIKEGTIITLDQIPIVEKYFGLNIAILSDEDIDDYLYGDENCNIKILLKNDHYSLITKVSKEAKDKIEKKKKN